MEGLQESILNMAIQKEIHTRDFYANVAAKITNTSGRKASTKAF